MKTGKNDNVENQRNNFWTLQLPTVFGNYIIISIITMVENYIYYNVNRLRRRYTNEESKKDEYREKGITEKRRRKGSRGDI
ncbi:MAG: hypothetical protein Q8O41_01240 [Candidatus Methanoperedens sp.]|nr:hypothetical protein [Candidatus Methanoperedens sp.]